MCATFNPLMGLYTYAHFYAPGATSPFVCLSARSWHPLPTLQENEPVPQVIVTGCKPVLSLLYFHACENLLESKVELVFEKLPTLE